MGSPGNPGHANAGRDPHEPLRADVRLLGALLGETLQRRGGPELFETVERVRALAKEWRGAADLDALAGSLRALPVAMAVPVARAFSHFLALANIAEQHHRIRRRRDYQRSPDSRPQPGSFEEVFARLLGRGVDPATLHATAAALQIELVLTAHPTAITRRTLNATYGRIAEALASKDRPDLTPNEGADVAEALRREILTAWETEDVRPRRPTPVEEAISGLLIFEQTLWAAVPCYLRAFDRALRSATGRALPIEATPIRFASWMGGDRDGNPTVTPEVTRRVCLLSRWIAADLYLRDIEALRLELSSTVGTPDLRARARGAGEPYREVLREVRDRMRATRDDLQRQLDEPAGGLRSTASATADPGPSAAPYRSVAQLLEPLQLCYESLVETGQELIAGGPLADTLRRAHVFGLTLVRLDLRQHAAQHRLVLDAVTRGLGAGAYTEWDERGRLDFLMSALRGEASVALPESDADDEVREVVATFRMAAAIHPESLSAYVVSMAEAASDVLAVEFLKRGSGLALPVVPLFEEVGALRRAAPTLRALFAIPEYRQAIGGRQQVMIGYSDSAKESGRVAANWALYKAQEEIVAACRDEGVELTLFHGRGGSIGRGGGPTYLAVQSQPPGSVEGRLRVTEQGEMIQAQFGLPEIAVRTLEVYTTATLDATLAPPERPPDTWRAAMDRIAEEARAAYRKVVFDDPRFVPYFRAATPEVELGAFPIGSRPARRRGPGKDTGVDSLRAIPWVFAWTQTRLLLPSWLGAGEALGEALARGGRDELRAMYREWPFFRSTLDLIEMVLAKTNPEIAAEYDRQLVPERLQDLGVDLRERLRATIGAMLDVTASPHLLESNPVLRRSIAVRNPYVDPINLVQIELLRRLRSKGGDDPDLLRAFMITVNGVAAGMRNTG